MSDHSIHSATTVNHKNKSIPWLFSPAVDTATFLGSAVAAMLLLAVGVPFGWLHSDTPEWTWVAAILLIDVAHVYSTGFRVYFDRQELLRRPWLYGLTPLLAFLVSWSIYSESPEWFWTTLAYLAVFHFVRQQYGWVALYRARGGETSRVGWWIDSSAIYMSTIYPLVHWHTHLPRNFWWFRTGDFEALPDFLSSLLAPVYWIALSAYFLRSAYRALKHRKFCPGKDIVVATTAFCWYVGIVAFNSDYAFTVTNVIIHGVPYMVLVYWYKTTNDQSIPSGVSERSSGRSRRIASFLGVIWILAYAEELLWDVGVWQERPWLFGGDLFQFQSDSVAVFLVPLLAVPQITHYVLDGFIWRRRNNQTLSRLIKC